MLVLDDVQWADADSLALLAHVTREVTRARLLVVATVRPAERDLALGGLVIELFGWDDAEVGAALERWAARPGLRRCGRPALGRQPVLRR